MADKDGNKLAKDYGIGTPPPARTFHVKGLEYKDWGMQTRLAKIFQDDGHTIMLAFDHGYIMGPTAGLKRLDLVIPKMVAKCQHKTNHRNDEANNGRFIVTNNQMIDCIRQNKKCNRAHKDT